MNATIDIKTPSGKSLSHFPVTIPMANEDLFFDEIVDNLLYYLHDTSNNCVKCHKGDVITITIV